MQPPDGLPQEMWWIVCQELTARRDFTALFNFALVSRSMAELALPLLYGIHEQASACADDASIDGKQKLAALWRSIILSSVEKTVYPYCLWLKNLRLGNLLELLRDLAATPHLREAFFKGEMAQFNLPMEGAAKPTRQTRARLDLQAINTQVGETITAFVKGAAERENKTVALAHLEGHYIPMHVLPRWMTRLSMLVSLTIQDGSVIGSQVGAAIRDHCPNFKELECYYCDGPSVDADLAGFFLELPRNSLQAFSVISINRVGKEAFEALGRHASSLRKLGLSTLQFPAFEHLGALNRCSVLRSLILEAAAPIGLNWETEYKTSFLEVAAWLRDLQSLNHLRLHQVPGGTALLGDVLKSPHVRLRDVDLKLRDNHESFFSSLANQSQLESLTLRIEEDLLEPATPQHALFLRSVCRCQSLKRLDLMQTLLTVDDVKDISRSLTYLEEFSFDGDDLNDDVFEPLLALTHLKSVNINAISAFTFEGIMDFINSLATCPVSRRGFGLYIMNQSGIAELSADEQEVLGQQIVAAVGGRLDMVFHRDPDDEHEGDFSD